MTESRIFIGNLSSTVTEYAVIKLFSKFGEIVKIDFLWNTSGPRRGEPRGYCFLDFKDPEVNIIHDILLFVD